MASRAFSWVVMSGAPYCCCLAAIHTPYCCLVNRVLLPYVKNMGKNIKTPKTFRFSDEELALLASLSDGRNMTETLVEGLKALREQRNNQPTDAELVHMMAERLGVKLK